MSIKLIYIVLLLVTLFTEIIYTLDYKVEGSYPDYEIFITYDSYSYDDDDDNYCERNSDCIPSTFCCSTGAC